MENNNNDSTYIALTNARKVKLQQILKRIQIKDRRERNAARNRGTNTLRDEERKKRREIGNTAGGREIGW